MTDPTDERLTRIEETLGFAQHDLDELSTQVRSVYDALGSLTRKLDALERRLNESGSDDDAPADETTP
jgi:YD repeat-containing protein